VGLNGDPILLTPALTYRFAETGRRSRGAAPEVDLRAGRTGWNASSKLGKALLPARVPPSR
jgi:hypothetical protein